MRKVALFFLLSGLASWLLGQETFIPHFTYKNGWETALTLSNMGGAAANLTLTAWSDEGQAFESKTLLLEGHEGKTLDLRQVFTNLNGQRGWLELQGAENIHGLLRFRYLATGGETSLPIGREAGVSMVLPYLVNNDHANSGFALVNLGDASSTVELRLVDLERPVIQSAKIALPAKGKATLMVADVFPDAIPQTSRLEIHSLTEITGFALTFLNDVQQVVAVPGSQWDAGLEPSLQDLLNDLMEGESGGVSLGIQKGDEPMISVAAGEAYIGHESMTPLHASQLGSVTKTMVAALVMMLQEDGALNIESTLNQWLPQFPRAERITLRHLLSHSSGVPDYLTDDYYLDILNAGGDYIWQADELLDYALAEEPLFEPGVMGSYSNTNYLLLAMVVEKITGQTLAQQLRTRIWDPLGMRHTYLRGFETPDFPVAHGYLWDPQQLFFPTALTDTSFLINGTSSLGDGGAGSTVEDLIIFTRALAKGQLVSAETLEEMTQPFDSEWPYGLGLELFVDFPAGAYGHTGSFVWGNAIMIYFPEVDAFLATTRNLLSIADEDDSIEVDALILGMAALGLLDDASQNKVKSANLKSLLQMR